MCLYVHTGYTHILIDRQCSALWDCCIYGIEGDRCCFRVGRLICGHLKLLGNDTITHMTGMEAATWRGVHRADNTWLR